MAKKGPRSCCAKRLTFLHSWNRFQIPVSTFAESSSANVAKPPSEGGAEQTGKDVSRFRRTAPACGEGSRGMLPRGVEGLAPPDFLERLLVRRFKSITGLYTFATFVPTH